MRDAAMIFGSEDAIAESSTMTRAEERPAVVEKQPHDCGTTNDKEDLAFESWTSRRAVDTIAINRKGSIEARRVSFSAGSDPARSVEAEPAKISARPNR